MSGVPAKPLTVGLNGRLTGEAVLEHANALSCDLLTKGAYTQSRLRQFILGGTTQYILSNATLPVFMAHSIVRALCERFDVRRLLSALAGSAGRLGLFWRICESLRDG